jgi:hypothetical protein
MRGLRSTIALLVVLIGLGAYIYFVTWKRPADSGPKQEKVLPRCSRPDRRVEGEGRSGDVTTLKKTSGRVPRHPDGYEPRRRPRPRERHSALSALEIERGGGRKPTDVKDYGLETPRIEIDFKAKRRQGLPGRLAVGAKTPTGASMSPGGTTRSGSSWSRRTRMPRSTNPPSIFVTSRSSRLTARRSTAWR